MLPPWELNDRPVLPASKHSALLFDVLAPLCALDRLRAPDGDLLASLLGCPLLLGNPLLILELGIVLLVIGAEVEHLLEAELESGRLVARPARDKMAPPLGRVASIFRCAAREAESPERLHPVPREASKHS